MELITFIVLALFGVLIFNGLKNKKEMKDNGSWTGSWSEQYAADRKARYEKEQALHRQCDSCARQSICREPRVNCNAWVPKS